MWMILEVCAIWSFWNSLKTLCPVGLPHTHTATEAAGLVDEYVLIHKSRPGEPVREPVLHNDGGSKFPILLWGICT